MNEILKWASGTVGLIILIAGALWTGMTEIRALDQKFVPLSEWQDFQWSQLKRDLRDIERELAKAEDEGLIEYVERLEEEREDLLEFLCRKYPDDREC